MVGSTQPRKLSEFRICKDLSMHVIRRILNSTIRGLQGMDAGLSGENGLKSVWDEIVVQVKGEQSFEWDTYLLTMTCLIDGAVVELHRYELEAVWILTPEGESWDCENEEDRDVNPACDDEVVDYILQSHLLARAADYENQRILTYLEKGD
jgi:hypothetical protein